MDTAVLDRPAVREMVASAADMRRAVEQVIKNWECPPAPLRSFAVIGVCDTARDRYTLQELSRPHGLQVANTLVHLEIRNGKIYIEADATEEGIGSELAAAGIPKSQIVLAFYPPEIREMGEFAVS